MILAGSLALALLIAIPARAVWLGRAERAARSQSDRYLKTIVKALVLLLWLFIVARSEGITNSDLGLQAHIGIGGKIGFAIALIVLGGLTVATFAAKPGPRKVDEKRVGLLKPEGARELRLFFLFIPLIGFAWELLYRGYLLWWLIPLVGTPLAVAFASVSYGLAHGWKSFQESFLSFGSAFLFTIAYALTGSLWWLITIHIGLPLIGFFAVRRVVPPPNHEVTA